MVLYDGALFTNSEIGVDNSIDPMYFKDDDGKAYLIWGAFTASRNSGGDG
jgi:beta-xylosidase